MGPEREFTEREGFSGFGDLGELPEDLRGMLPGSIPDPSMYVGFEADVYSTIGGASRAFVEPIPGGFGTQAANWSSINYLPRANYPSFRSQRFFVHGSALVPPSGGTATVDLLVDIATLPPGAPQTSSSGVYIIPAGFAAVITGLSQWVGDATAFQKPDGSMDDISWRIQAGGSPIFNYGNFPCLISALDNEAEMFAVLTEGSIIQLSVINNLSASSPDARSIPVKGALTGHQFPMDELDDMFRNR